LRRSTKAAGDTSEAVALARFVAAGLTVSVPFGEDSRYDLLVDDGETIHRVQVKTGRLRKGVVNFHTASMHYHRSGGSTKDYRGSADFFAVFCPDNDVLYVVPVEDVGLHGASLRVEPAKNGQSSGVRLAERYAW
jgi:hypothetical protein